MKAVLTSIKPKYCELIANDKKTIELRKTKPKIDVPFKGYIYCTNTKPFLVWGDVFRGDWCTEFTHLTGYSRQRAEEIWDVFNGKVIGEYTCNNITDYDFDYGAQEYDVSSDDLSRMCLDHDDLWKYGQAQTLYGQYISDLVIYDEPKELSEFGLKRPPQSWCYVKELGV